MDAFYGPFDEGFMPGISAINWSESERITWRFGVFRPLKNSFGIGFYDYTVAGRVTALPVYADDGARLLHVGFGASQGSLVDDEFRIRARPLLRNGPGYAVPLIADTTKLPGDSKLLLCPEMAAVLGPWTFQAEWTGGFVSDAVAANGQRQGTVFFQGGYAQVLYFLTGEHQGNCLVAHRDGQQAAGDGWFSGLGVRAAFDF